MARGQTFEPKEEVNIQDSGTSMRLLTAVSLLADGPVILTGSKRMKERPLGPLVETLNKAGGRITTLKNQVILPSGLMAGFLAENSALTGYLKPVHLLFTDCCPICSK